MYRKYYNGACKKFKTFTVILGIRKRVDLKIGGQMKNGRIPEYDSKKERKYTLTSMLKKII